MENECAHVQELLFSILIQFFLGSLMIKSSAFWLLVFFIFSCVFLTSFFIPVMHLLQFLGTVRIIILIVWNSLFSSGHIILLWWLAFCCIYLPITTFWITTERVVAIKNSTSKVIFYKLSYILVLNLVMHFVCRVFLENIQSSSSICSYSHKRCS